MSSDWSTRAKVVARRSYNRPLDESGEEFESWEQTINRVIRHQRWLWERAKKKDLNGSEMQELDHLRELMIHRQGFLAGRTLWLGGTELSRTRESCNFNCLKKSTKFITINGVKSFEDFEDGDKVMVWTHKGQWKPAIVKSYGKQKLYNITLYRNHGTPTVVSATRNHRWLLQDGTETTKLRVGDSLMRPISTHFDAKIDETFAFQLSSNFDNIVRSIEPDIEEDVWCLEVEDDHSFTLANGIVTGNCSALSVKTVFDIVDAFWLLLQGCFVSGTLVEMGDGSFTPIESIKEGDLVKSYNVDTQEFCVKPVVRLNINPLKSLVKVTLENGEEIICTEDHLFLTTEGWVAAQDLEDKEIIS